MTTNLRIFTNIRIIHLINTIRIFGIIRTFAVIKKSQMWYLTLWSYFSQNKTISLT